MNATSEFKDHDDFRNKKDDLSIDPAGALNLGAGIILLISVLLYVISPDTKLVNDFAPNAIGLSLTILVIDQLNRMRSSAERKEELILQMGSRSNDFALEAVRLLENCGMIKNGSLKKSSLRYASLQDADLEGVNLNKADLQGANLKGARLEEAKLEEVNLSLANLEGAYLLNANLEGAYLFRANLQEADLRGAYLEKANMLEANLRGADLWQAMLDVQTILPDKSRWTSNTDMTRFTDPSHPEFWEPYWVKERREKNEPTSTVNQETEL